MDCNKIAIMTSIPAELHLFEEFLVKNKFAGKEIITAVCGVGKASAAASTQKVISEEKPDLMIYTGFAGALTKDLSLDDIIIVSSAIDAEMDARAFNPDLLLGQFPLTQERVFRTDPRLVKLAMSFPFPYDNLKSDGFIATTSIFMDSIIKKGFLDNVVPFLEADIDGVKRTPNLVDMESVGFIIAANASKVPCLIIRIVSNTVEGDTVDDYLDYAYKKVWMYMELITFIINNLDKIKE